MSAYLEKAKELMGTFLMASIKVIPWSKNANIDALAKLALTRDTKLLDVISVEFLTEPNIKWQPETMELTHEPSWVDPIIVYLRNGELPEGKIETCILRLKVARYILYDDKLYKRDYSMSLLKCISPSDAEYVMKEIHKGKCGNHTVG